MENSSRGNVPYHRESGLVGMTCLKITIHPFSLNFEQIKKKKGPNTEMVRTTETFKVFFFFEKYNIVLEDANR